MPRHTIGWSDNEIRRSSNRPKCSESKHSQIAGVGQFQVSNEGLPRAIVRVESVACFFRQLKSSMRVTERMARWFIAPVLTKRRIALAFTVAVLTDTAQFLLGPVGWILIDDALDVVAMILTSAALGFHPLLLPTFVIELLPLAD